MKHRQLTVSVMLLVLACTTSVSAEVYRSVDQHGNVTFTNQATPGAEPVQLKPLSVYGAPVLKTDVKSTASEEDKTQGYESVEIISPLPDETVRDNPGNVAVTVSSKPPLDSREGHRYQFILDGQAVDKPQTATTKVLTGVDRGEHQIEVTVVDAKGRELARSSATRFFLHRQTIFNPARSGGAS
ncbi:DUF4124 domain-containing protein [Thiogranum longum]|nr:DUF4124 domain-containing protein [Thiogranum longum]